MPRDKIKTAQLDLDTAYGIRLLCNGNLKEFYDTWVRGEIAITEFYNAMKPMEDCTPKVDQAIEEAYLEALLHFGLTTDTISIMPKFDILLRNMLNDLEYAESDKQGFNLDKFLFTHKVYLKFYIKAIEKGTIAFEKSKRTRLIS